RKTKPAVGPAADGHVGLPRFKGCATQRPILEVQSVHKLRGILAHQPHAPRKISLWISGSKLIKVPSRWKCDVRIAGSPLSSQTIGQARKSNVLCVVCPKSFPPVPPPNRGAGFA